ncbi:MAG: 3-isopropylmalate dehydratase small subunit [Sphingobium sp.]
MKAFTHLTAIAAYVPADNIDTDKILPAHYLKAITRSGLGRGLFAALRNDPDFILNRTPWDKAGILIGGGNFGCGSSREHAPWALLDFGIRCVIAPGFADIFHANCFKNGILPVVLPEKTVRYLGALAENAATASLTVDLERQTVTTTEGDVIPFATDEGRRHRLLNGLDDIGLSLKHLSSIDGFEADLDRKMHWKPPVTQASLQAVTKG